MKRLEDEANVCLTTFRRDGTPVDTPVWVVGRQGRLYLNTAAGSFKVKRIRANPAIRLAPCSMRGTVTGAWHSGKARIVNEAAVVEPVRRAFRAKYRWSLLLLPLFARFSRRYRERVFVEVTLDS